MKYTPPKSVINHPAVASCMCGEEEGSDQKHYVILKDGYWFGPIEQVSSLFFNHVRKPKNQTGRIWENWAARIEKKS